MRPPPDTEYGKYCTKITYPNRQAAEGAGVIHPEIVKPYECKRCGEWHLTSKSKRGRYRGLKGTEPPHYQGKNFIDILEPPTVGDTLGQTTTRNLIDLMEKLEEYTNETT